MILDRINKTIISILAISIFSFSSIQAKSGFRDGYIITTNKDTIFGKIDYRSDFNKSKSCIFKTDSGTIEYFPNMIDGYGYLNDRFFSSLIIEGIFVEILVSGELSLYKSGYDFYVQKRGNELFKIESKIIRDTIEVVKRERIDRISVDREDTKWKGMLAFLTSDCIECRQEINQLLLTDKRLIKFVKNYNKCKGDNFISYQTTLPRFKIDYGISTGLVFSILKFKNLPDQFELLAESYQSCNPAFGLLFALSSPRISEKLALQIELNYFKVSFNSQIIDKNTSFTGYYDSYIDYSTLSVPLSLRYSIPLGKSNIFFNAGIDFTYIKDSHQIVNKEVLSGNVVDTYIMGAFDFNNHPVGYWGDIGFLKSFKHFRIGTTLKYCHSSELTSNDEFNSGLNTISLSILLLGK